MIDVDVETTGLQWNYHLPFMAQFGDDETAANFDTVDLIETRALKFDQRVQDWLDRDDDFRAWNSKFDFHMLEAAGYRLPPQSRWHDGMVLAALVNENIPNALKVRGSRMFGEGERDYEVAVKAWISAEKTRRTRASKEETYAWLEEQGHPQKRNRNPQVPAGLATPETLRVEPVDYSMVPSELMDPYAKQDIVLTRRVCDALEPKLPEQVRSILELENKTMGALYDMEKRGLPVDQASIGRLANTTAARLSGYEGELRAMVGHKSNFNPNSSVQVAEALERAGADLRFVERSGKSGNLKMDEENLSAVDHEIAAKVLQFRGEFKLLSTYALPLLNPSVSRGINFEPFVAPDGRIHSNYNQVGARTGRMSSSGPNLQNWPRDDLRLRYTAVADPGHKLVACDMDAIEARLLAMYAGPGRLLATLRNGGDIHTLTAKGVGLSGRQRVTGFESPRQQGKRFNYLMMYGGGANAISKWFLVPKPKAGEMKDAYRSLYPEVANLDERIQWKLREVGFVHTLYGRRQRLKGLVREEGYKFLNYLIQGTAADMLKMAIVELHAAGIPMVAPVHDEIVAHVPEKDAAEVAILMERAMTNFPEVAQHVPLFAEPQIVDRWSEAKDPEFIPDYEEALRG